MGHIWRARKKQSIAYFSAEQFGCPGGAFWLGFNKPQAETIMDTDEDPHFSVCSDRYRYTFCNNGEEELYDHLEDPNEWTNLAGDPDFKEIARELRAEMKKILGKSGYIPAHPATVVP